MPCSSFLVDKGGIQYKQATRIENLRVTLTYIVINFKNINLISIDTILQIKHKQSLSQFFSTFPCNNSLFVLTLIFWIKLFFWFRTFAAFDVIITVTTKIKLFILIRLGNQISSDFWWLTIFYSWYCKYFSGLFSHLILIFDFLFFDWLLVLPSLANYLLHVYLSIFIHRFNETFK